MPAACGVRQLQLSVTAGNPRALYESLGFAEYGMEPEGLCVNGVLHDERLMTLRLAGD